MFLWPTSISLTVMRAKPCTNFSFVQVVSFARNELTKKFKKPGFLSARASKLKLW